MWSPLFEVKNRYIAEVWRELFNTEGVATRIIVRGDLRTAGDLTPRQIWVPDSKTHVALEIMRKI